MSEEAAVLKTLDNEIHARMTQQLLQITGVRAFVFKDDAGGMEPHLQRTTGVRLVVNRADVLRGSPNTRNFDLRLNGARRLVEAAGNLNFL